MMTHKQGYNKIDLQLQIPVPVILVRMRIAVLKICNLDIDAKIVMLNSLDQSVKNVMIFYLSKSL